MRYRSATVADSHGLPLNLERNKRTADLRRLRERGHTAQSFFVRAYLAKHPPHPNARPAHTTFLRGDFLLAKLPAMTVKNLLLIIASTYLDTSI